MEDLEVAKLGKLIQRRYVEKGRVSVVIPRMSVPKGDDDIGVVWDMTRNGVNPGTSVSSFFLLGIYSLNLKTSAGTYVSDFDCGEMFNTFQLHPSVRHNFGVHLSESVRRKLEVGYGLADLPEFMRWARLPFGWRPAPEFAVRMMMRSVEIAKGEPDDETSPFCFSRVVLNLPGLPDYDPGMPRVYKVRKDGALACDVVVFVDDGRVLGATIGLCREGMRKIVTGIQWRGTQDAARKREGASLKPRTWTGGVTHTDKGMVRKFLVPKKWNKIKEFVGWVLNSTGALDRKTFESGVGFLIHASATYDFLRPYLIGFYLAMNQFREGRNPDGWRSSVSPGEKDGNREGLEDEIHDALDAAVESAVDPSCNFEEDTKHQDSSVSAPPTVEVTDLLRRNADTIRRLTLSPHPLQVIVRPVSGKENVVYAGSDASGDGFGVRDYRMSDGSGEFVYGFWNDSTVGSSSNWREMKACLDKMRLDSTRGRLAGTEVWFITDNSTLERAYYKGYSQSVELYSMVEEMWALSLKGNFLLRIVHVAGTRIIDTGIDGLSRGDFELGLMRRPLFESIPLGLSSIERSPVVFGWLTSWLGSDFKVATPMDWHYNAQQSRGLLLDSQSETWVWDLAPGAALYALEELAMARTKRHDLVRGVVLVPHLLAPEWKRRFCKSVDLYFHIRPGTTSFWPSSMHESLTVGLYFPTFRARPWDWRAVEWMGDLGRTLSRLYATDSTRARDLLSKFWSAAQGVPSMSSPLVSHLLLSKSWVSLCGYGFRRGNNG